MKNNQHVDHARALRADILAAPQIWLPRREILLEWLNGFLLRAVTPRYELESTEAEDLNALERFLRQQHVPAA
jgi:hypothetical protein